MTPDSPIPAISSDAFREIFHGMSEGIVMVNENGVVVVANPRAEQIFGYEKNELTGMMLENLLPERYRGRHIDFRKGFNAHPEPRRMGFGRDLTALRKDGKEFPVEISLSFTKVNNQLLVMAFVSDISERKKAEVALRQSEEQLIVYAAELEKKVESRTQALHKTIEDMEKEVIERKRAEEEAQKALGKERELNELKSRFVSIASHEFRTPLSTVLSSASLIQQYKDRGDLTKVDKHVQRIKSSVNHLTTILNDFLSLGKLEEGKVDIQRENINLMEFFHEVDEEVRSSLKEGQHIEINCKEATHVDSDSRILRNILFNLISNASKYSDIHKKILLQCQQDNGVIVFSVQDQGMGIPKAEQKHIFDRFFRASNSGNVQGTGLGLHIVKRYVDLLGGNISFTSEHGKGTIFTILLPAN